jgi:small subunit ribosomal protein S1
MINEEIIVESSNQEQPTEQIYPETSAAETLPNAEETQANTLVAEIAPKPAVSTEQSLAAAEEQVEDQVVVSVSDNEPQAETTAPIQESSEITQPVEPVSTISAEAINAEATTAEAQIDAPETGVASASDEAADAKSARKERQEHFEKVFEALKEIKEKNEPIEVRVKARIRGGLRVIYNEAPLFLPASHFGIKKTPSETELQDTIGKTIQVFVHELQEQEDGRKTVIVSRKRMLTEHFWNQIQVGQEIEGKVSSVASFGVFVDIGGLEGLIHISRLSRIRVDNPATLYKKGDVVKAVIVEIDKENNRIALSRKELEDSPWKGIAAEFPVGSIHKGIVRRMTSFGAFVEIKPGIDGLLRISEMSWAKRVRKPSDVFEVNQEIDVKILEVSEEQKTVSLSYKKTTENPWFAFAEKYTVGATFNGIVMQTSKNGAVIRLNDEIDGFMPKSKMRNLTQGKRMPFENGDSIEVEISDFSASEESLILAPKQEENYSESNSSKQKKGAAQPIDANSAKNQGSFTLLDLISDKEKNSLYQNMPE